MKSAESSRKSGFQTEHEICPAVDGAAYMPGFGCPWLECMKILTNSHVGNLTKSFEIIAGFSPTLRRACGFHRTRRAIEFRCQGFKHNLHTSLQLYFLLLRSQHRHPLLSVWIFFVILEAVFVVSCFSFLNSTCGRPSTAYLFTASQVPCHYSHWDKEWLLPSHEGISIQHFTGCNCLRVPSFPRSDIPIMGHL